MGKTLSFSIKQEKPKVTVVTLESSDFMSQQEIDDGSIEPPEQAELRQFIGLEITVRRNCSLDTQLKWAQSDIIDRTTDPVKKFELINQTFEALSEMVVDWNMTDEEDKPWPVTTENIKKLTPGYYQAVKSLVGKASRMDPNSGRS